MESLHGLGYEWRGHQDFKKFLLTMEGTYLEAEPLWSTWGLVSECGNHPGGGIESSGDRGRLHGSLECQLQHLCRFYARLQDEDVRRRAENVNVPDTNFPERIMWQVTKEVVSPERIHLIKL